MTSTKQILGKGKFGEVVLIDHNGQLVAVKTVTYNSCDNNEVNILKSIKSSHVAQYYECIVVDNTHTTVLLEYIKGVNLLELTENPDFSELKESEIINILKQLADGLYDIHKANVIHRDIKLENIMYSVNDSKIKYIDFGLSTFHDEYTKKVVGTLNYIAPEYLKSANISDLYALDVYSLGTLFYFLLNLKFPYSPTKKTQFINLKLTTNASPSKNRYNNKILDKMVDMMLIRNPTCRIKLDDVITILNSM